MSAKAWDNPEINLWEDRRGLQSACAQQYQTPGACSPRPGATAGFPFGVCPPRGLVGCIPGGCRPLYPGYVQPGFCFPRGGGGCYPYGSCRPRIAACFPFGACLPRFGSCLPAAPCLG